MRSTRTRTRTRNRTRTLTLGAIALALAAPTWGAGNNDHPAATRALAHLAGAGSAPM